MVVEIPYGLSNVVSNPLVPSHACDLPGARPGRGPQPHDMTSSDLIVLYDHTSLLLTA